MLARFRVYVAGVVVDDVTTYIGDNGSMRAILGDLGESHARLTADAQMHGLPWMIDMGLGDEHVRWGTDANGMVEPIEVAMSQLVEVFNRRMNGNGR